MKSLPKIKVSLSTPICLAAFALIYGLPYIFAIFSATLLHEAGHLAAIYLLEGKVSDVTVRPFGAVINRSENGTSYRGDIIISLSGPLVNIVSFLICMWAGRRGTFASASLILALINLIPSKPLDGYCALKAASLSLFSPSASEKICRTVSFVILGAIWIFSVYMIIYANFNLSLLLMVTFLMCETLLTIK